MYNLREQLLEFRDKSRLGGFWVVGGSWTEPLVDQLSVITYVVGKCAPGVSQVRKTNYDFETSRTGRRTVAARP